MYLRMRRQRCGCRRRGAGDLELFECDQRLLGRSRFGSFAARNGEPARLVEGELAGFVGAEDESELGADGAGDGEAHGDVAMGAELEVDFLASGSEGFASGLEEDFKGDLSAAELVIVGDERAPLLAASGKRRERAAG